MKSPARQRPIAAQRDEAFVVRLGERLLSLAVDGMVAEAEYYAWEQTHQLGTMDRYRYVEDAVAASFADTQVPRDPENYNRCRMMVGLPALDFDDKPRGPAAPSPQPWPAIP